MESPQWKLDITIRRRPGTHQKGPITNKEVSHLQSEIGRRALELGFDIWPGPPLPMRQNCPHCGRIIRSQTAKTCPMCGRSLDTKRAT
jgi:hypothetical protein